MSVSNLVTLLLLVLGGSGGNDLLDYIPAEPYFRSKQVAFTYDALAAELTKIAADDTSRPASVRRLMAIRALGRMNNPAAALLLQSQLESKLPFVAEYARQSLAALQNHRYSRPETPPDRTLRGVLLMPGNCAVVGQINAHGGAGVDIDALLANIQLAPGQDRRQTIDAMTAALVNLAEQMGNVRISAITFGVSDDVAEEAGFAVGIIHATFDARGLLKIIEPLSGEPVVVDGVPVYKMDASTALIIGKDAIAFMVGASHEKLPVQQMVAAIRTRAGGITGNQPMLELMRAADREQAAWAVARVTPALAAASELAGLEGVRLLATHTATGMKFEIRARGADPQRMRESNDAFMLQVNHLQSRVQVESDSKPYLRAIVKLLASVDSKLEPPILTVTAALHGTPAETVIVPYILWNLPPQEPATSQPATP